MHIKLSWVLKKMKRCEFLRGEGKIKNMDNPSGIVVYYTQNICFKQSHMYWNPRS